jgi:hypothetical protein
MLFLRKKRQKRDQEAGLIFQWRGSRKHHIGKILALMIAVGCFAFSVYALKIESIKPPLLSKREGVVIMLNEDDPNCRKLMMQIEGKSPFPVRWDPVFDRGTLARIEGGVEVLVGEQWQYHAELVPMPAEKPPRGLASIIEPRDGLLGRVMNDWSEGNSDAVEDVLGDLFIRARVLAGGSIKTRLPGDELPIPADLVADDSFGQSFRFLLELDSAGVVQSCLPLLGGTMDAVKTTDRQKKLAAWLRTQRFKESDHDGVATGQLELQIEASRE